jgi:hypothetical protein
MFCIRLFPEHHNIISTRGSSYSLRYIDTSYTVEIRPSVTVIVILDSVGDGTNLL